MLSGIHKHYHPATIVLLRTRSRATLLRMLSSFRNPRRQVLAGVAVVLGIFWVFQAVASVMLRSAADRQQLLTWLPLGMFVYSAWHIIKISTRTPVEPFEWTPAEQELVCAAPLSRTQLISYRMVSIASSAGLKALCFSIVMLPDLPFWIAGFIGMFLALLFVDLVRVCFELLFHGLSKRDRIVSRAAVLTAVFGVGGYTLWKCLMAPEAAHQISSPGALIFFQQLVAELMGMATSTFGAVLLMPFIPFTETILAQAITPRVLGFAGVSLIVVAAMAQIVYRLDTWSTTQTIKREQAALDCYLLQRNERRDQQQPRQQLKVPFRMFGIGSLAWRQILGAYHYRVTVLFSLGIPTLLCCVPLLANHPPFFMLLNVVAGIVFYSFLLLPSALILDFRRDLDRMVVLKALPISPLAQTIGQLATPVLICSIFQWIVLLISVVSGAVIGWQALVAATLLLPINILIFAIENFIFLLSPYRRNREGVDVFLRTILTFTGKGILFAIGLAVTLGWAWLSKTLAAAIGLEALGASLIFGIGGWLIVAHVAMAFVMAIAWQFERYDPSAETIQS